MKVTIRIEKLDWTATPETVGDAQAARQSLQLQGGEIAVEGELSEVTGALAHYLVMLQKAAGA